MPGVDPRIGHGDIDHREQFGQLCRIPAPGVWPARWCGRPGCRAAAARRDCSRHRSPSRPRCAAGWRCAVRARRTKVAHLYEVLAVVRRREIVGCGALAGKVSSGWWRGAEEACDLSPDRPELRLARRVRIGTVLAVDRGCWLRAVDLVVGSVACALREHRVADGDSRGELRGVHRPHASSMTRRTRDTAP